MERKLPKTAFRTPTPEEAMQDNDRRFRLARNHFGYIPFRLLPQIRIHHTDTIAWKGTPRKPRKQAAAWNNWGLIRGSLVKIRVSEAIDVYELLKDLKTFLEHWRPSRIRTAEGQSAARACLEMWKNLAR